TLLHEDNVREGFCAPPEFARLLSELRARKAPDVADAAEFAYLTCLRRGNVLGAQWSWFTLRIEDGAVTGGSVRLPGAVTKNKKPLPLVLMGNSSRSWRIGGRSASPNAPTCFTAAGAQFATSRPPGSRRAQPSGLSGLLFHDLRRSGARNYRRAGVTEE